MTRDEAIALVHGLVAIPSLSRQEQAATAWLVDRMRQAGYDRAFVDAAGNAVGELGPANASRVIVLLGHIDTVPGDIKVRIEERENGRREAGGEDRNRPGHHRAHATAPADGTGERSGVAALDSAQRPASDDRSALVLYGRGSVDAKGPLATFVAAAARLGSAWAHDAGVRLVVVGAVEEESATSKGARFVASRFDGVNEPTPLACVIGEPSSWRRVTLGYKGRLLLDLTARQDMAHTAGPDASVAEAVVDVWNFVRQHAAEANAGIEKPFDQLSPSLRRFITANEAGLTDTVDAQIAWRLPVSVDADALVRTLLAWSAAHIGAPAPAPLTLETGEGRHDAVTLDGTRTSLSFRFRGWEQAWRADRNNALVRSFLAAIREIDPAAQPGFVVKTGTSDMNVVAPVWRCPILAYGPGDSALDHTPNEHLPLDEYWTAVRILEQALRNLAGV